MNEHPWPFYVSYSWRTKKQRQVVNKLQQDTCQFPTLKLVRDMNQDKCCLGDSIAAFLKEVGQAPRLVLFLSKPYFQSIYTLKELAAALACGGIDVRIKIVLVGNFRLDRYLEDLKPLKAQFAKHKIQYQPHYDKMLQELQDMIVVSHGQEDTDFTPLLQMIMDTYQAHPNPETERTEDLDYFRTKVRQLFDDSHRLTLLKTQIKEKAAVQSLTGAIETLICSDETGDFQENFILQVLLPAVDETLNSLQRSDDLMSETLDDCLQVVGWLAVMLVNDLWIKQYGESIRDQGAPGKIEIGLGNGRGHLLELVVARANKKEARLAWDKKKLTCGSGLVLEMPDAMDAGVSLQFICLRLTERFMPAEDFSSMDEDEVWEELAATIQALRATENVFIAFPRTAQWGGNLHAELSRKLSCLPQLWLKKSDKDAPIFCLTEVKVWRYLSRLVDLIENKRR